jgi:hypothetical protein
MAGPTQLNSRENALLAAQDLESRPHELPSLAKKGILQYRYKKAREGRGFWVTGKKPENN